MSACSACLVVPFTSRIALESVKGCLISSDNRILALHSSDASVSLFSMEDRSFVNGFKASEVLFFNFVSVGRITLLVTFNSKGSLVFYRYVRGRGRKGFYVRMVVKGLHATSSGTDPILFRLEEDVDEEEEESIFCWEVPLERLSSLVDAKNDKIMTLSEVMVSPEGRHVVLVASCARGGSMVLVLDISTSVALRRWFPVQDGEALDMDVVHGRREVVGLTDVGPRSLGTDTIMLHEEELVVGERRRREWLPPNLENLELEPLCLPCPPDMFELFCDGGKKTMWLGAQGLYLPVPDKHKLLKATLIFEGVDAALELAEKNSWDSQGIRSFALELAFRHGDVEAVRKSLEELPVALREDAHTLASKYRDSMKWDLLRAWARSCALWAVEDGDVKAALEVKRVRMLMETEPRMLPSLRTPSNGAKRSLVFLEEAVSLSPSRKPSAAATSWKPAKTLRRMWDGKSDDEVARQAALSGRLSEGAAFLRWRSGHHVSILAHAKEVAYRALCNGNLEEASAIIANCGAANVGDVIAHVRECTVRPFVRRIAGGWETEEKWVQELFLLHGCTGGPVDDVQEGKLAYEEPTDGKKPPLRASIKWIKEWGREVARDVLLDATVGRSEPVPEPPEWDAKNLRVLSFFCRHGNERAAKRFCQGNALTAEEVSVALADAAPHVAAAVLFECAKSGIHPFGVNSALACAAGAMLQREDVAETCVKISLDLRRSAMFQTLMDAGAKFPESVSSSPWSDFCRASRAQTVDVALMSRLCAVLIHGLLLDATDDLHALDRPLISVADDIYNGRQPKASELEKIGSLAMKETPMKPSVFRVDTLIPAQIGNCMPVVEGSAKKPSREAWLQRDMPFRAFECEGDMAGCFVKQFKPVPLPPISSSWVMELVESSLDPGRKVSFPSNSHITMLLSRKGLPLEIGALGVTETPHTSSLDLNFRRGWVNLRLRKEGYGLATSLSDEDAMKLLDEFLKTQSSWDIGHLLNALDQGRGGKFTVFRKNWEVIARHNLDPMLLHASSEEVGNALRKLGLWDAAREVDEAHSGATTLLQAERLVPNWNRIAALFDELAVGEDVREKFWLQKVLDAEETVDLGLLSLARQSCPKSDALEVRFVLAEFGRVSWTVFLALSDEERLKLVQSVCGMLASNGEADQATKLCRALSCFPPVMEVLGRKFTAVGELEAFLRGEFGASWRKWAEGVVLRIRANVDPRVAPDSVCANLAFDGQVALARDWAIHFKPDAKKLSRALASRFVDTLRHHYPSVSPPSSLVSLASPSGRAMPSPGIDVSWSDSAWADYVAVGGSPSDIGDVLFEAFTGEGSQVVRSVELLVRAHACYSLACNLEGIERVTQAAARLATSLADSGLYQHLVRLVTGVGNYSRLEFCFGKLLDAEHFELILRKNPMMSYGGRLDLRASLFCYLKKHRPEDKRSMNLLMLSFSMYREIGETLEEEARELVKQVQLTKSPATLLSILSKLIDASDAYHKDRCLQKAEKALSLARLVKLQTQKPDLRLLYENGADAAKLTTFAEAETVAVALGLPSDWYLNVAYQQVVLGGNMQYLDALVKRKSPSVPVSQLFHELVSYFKSQNAPTASLTSVLRQCPDIFLAFDLCMEFNLEKLAEELSIQHSSIRSFKLLNVSVIK